MSGFRGADLVAQTLSRAGVTRIFSLSGNHIMPIYDAAIDARLEITHTRHEGAAVHMADAWGRLTDTPGVALLTGGPGHANGVGALYTALEAESPVVMLSGHAPVRELGRGSFQEMRQADMAAPTVKAAWTARSAIELGEDIARALRIATSGRPGPVHVSLPVDLLDSEVAIGTLPDREASQPDVQTLADSAAEEISRLISQAQRPLVLSGPVMARAHAVQSRLVNALGAPVLSIESPRGLNDPAQGALAHVVSRADLVVLFGKRPDFTLRFAEPPAFDRAARFVVIEPENDVLSSTLEILGEDRVVFSAIADTLPAAGRLAGSRGALVHTPTEWMRQVERAVRFRPREWATLEPKPDGPVHPVDVGRAVHSFVARSARPIFVSDGGEFGQWAQACVSAETRLINGQSGSIGSAIPFALAARVARPDATVVAMSGDGACGFHLLEMETAVRSDSPFVVVVGNDACWNAEHQIQLRTYGEARAHSCELAPTRYDEVVRALGGHGELVTRPRDLEGALSRAAAAGKPALVNVMIERLPAPTVTAAQYAQS